MSPRPSDTLAVGDSAPEFTLRDADDRPINRSAWQGRRSLLLVFFRGTWCPQCRAHLERLGDHVAALQERNVRLLGVAAQKRSRLSAYLARNPVPFPILADEDRAVSRAYGVHVPINFESLNIARPSSFLIDRSGIVRWIHVGSHQFDRPGMDEVLARIGKLPAEPADPTGS